MDHFQELYDKYEALSGAKDKIAEHASEFEECIEGTKGGPREKKLAAQIISQFFKHFPALQDQALDALLTLCENDDSIIRICAMKALPPVCKYIKNKGNVATIASILAQLLQLDDQEYITACASLTQVFKEDQISATRGILTNINQPNDELLRDRCVTFLYKKLTKLQMKVSPELEEILIDEGKKILKDCTSNEFMVVMPYLLESKLAKTIAGQLELVDITAKRVELNENFDPLEEGTNNTDRLILCINCILPLFNANVDSSQFVLYYAQQVLPQWKKIGELQDGEKFQVILLKQLAELTAHCGNLENITEVVENIFEKLKEFMPLPPENADVTDLPNLAFTSVECLLYAFHKLARKCPEFLTKDQERRKDFCSRLQYFSRGVQGCKRGLESTVNSKKEDLTPEAAEKLRLAPLVLDNINTIIKDLYHTPLYKCTVKLSFKDVTKKIHTVTEKSPIQQKRHAPITFESSNGTTNPKQARSNKSGEDRKLYAPPSGKFSSTFGRSGSRGSWNRGGNRTPRGSRGGSRNWRN